MENAVQNAGYTDKYTVEFFDECYQDFINTRL